jgi:head-tail adaptor
VWGELLPLLAGTREAFAQQSAQFQARVSYQCRLRWRALTPATNRLVVDGRTFEVTGVMDPDGHKWELLVLCYEVQ